MQTIRFRLSSPVLILLILSIPVNSFFANNKSRDHAAARSDVGEFRER